MEEINMFSEIDYEILDRCPWCGCKKNTNWGRSVRGFYSVRCSRCALIYVKNRFNKNGLEKFYKGYLTNVHQVDKNLNKKREQMYDLEFELISAYCHEGDVLDIGCSGGYFLDHFKRREFNCYGIEYCQKAAEEAIKKHQVYFGDFSEMKINRKFDLIVFRGVIEHIPHPKVYLEKAVNLLKRKGFLYITSTPNSESFCCELFREQWNQHVPEEHLMHFSVGHFDDFFLNNDFQKIIEHYYYEETPYADIENDILLVAKAIVLCRKRKMINFRSPAFYRNMMSLIYRKC